MSCKKASHAAQRQSKSSEHEQMPLNRPPHRFRYLLILLSMNRESFIAALFFVTIAIGPTIPSALADFLSKNGNVMSVEAIHISQGTPQMSMSPISIDPVESRKSAKRNRV